MDSNGEVGIVEASMELVDKDTLLKCPYDEVHMVRAKRFQYHLMKCRKNYVGNDMITCPYNARHVIPRPEQRHHISTCVDKVLLEADAEYNTRIQHDERYQGNISVPKYLPDRDVEPTGENWDDDLEDGVGHQYLQPRDTNGMLSYQTQTHPTNNGYNRLPEKQPSLRQPRSQPASMVQPQQEWTSGPLQQHAHEQPLPHHQLPSYQPLSHQEPPNIQRHPQTESLAAPTPASNSSWAQVAGIGRGISRKTERFPALSTPGIGRGVVKAPPGFGRGHSGQRGPTIAANIYNNPQS